MLDVLASIALQLAPSVLGELVPILGEKLRQKLLSPTQEGTTPRVEIKDAEIIEKIKETLQKRDELIKDDIKNNHETMKQLIQQVLDEIKILSARTPDLEVGSDEIGLSEPIQQIDKEFDSQELEARLEEIKRSLEESIAKRLTEIQTGLTSQVNNIPLSVIHKDDKQELAPGTNVEMPVPANSPSKIISQTDNITKQVRSEPSKSEQRGNQDEKQGLPLSKNMEAQVPENPQSKIMLENLHKYKEYGEGVLRGLKSLEPYQSSANEILDNRQLQDCLKSLKDAANKTVELASSPVKIAVMGEFSSGKTLLVGSLIGYADALPVSEIPTTGNVTAIHLLQQDNFKTTEFDDFIVEYLSPQEVQECLDFMLGQAKQRAQASELPAFPQVNSKTLNEDTLNSYEKWCESAWNQTQNPDLRYLLRELIVFLRTYVNYGASLCGESLKITHTKAREGLKLTSISPANQELKFEDIPEVTKLPVDKNRPSSELLQNSFSLIRRVNINVKISKEIWNLGTTQDTAKFILLDFPGLGAANSGVRDTFVSLRELTQVQTILILLNGRTPGSDRAQKIFNMIEQKRPGQNLKDFILVGVGRFNQLSIEREQKLDQLINSATNNPLTEATVFQEFSGLKTIIGQAEALTSQKDRIVLLDQLISLADLAKLSSAVKVGSQEFLAKLEDQNDSSLQQSKRMREKWQSLSKSLLATNPQSLLGRQLGYFAQDGGISKLRELILNHVGDRSLKQLYEDTRKDGTDKLRQQQDNLKKILSGLGITTEESPALKELRDAIEKIYRIYNRFKDNLGKQLLQDAKEVPISDVIKDEVIYRIREWKQWNLLFNQVQDGRIVLPPGTEGKNNPFGGRNKPNVNIPTKSDDFSQVFENAVKELKNFAEDCIQKAVNHLLQNLSNQLSPEIEQLKAKLREEMETEIEEKFSEEQAYTFSILYQGYNPEKWGELESMKELFQEEKSIETVTVFPLARQDEKHEIGQIFDWASEYSKSEYTKGDSPQTLHQVLLVQRLRDEITASISLHIIEYVSQINKKVDKAILQILNILTPELDTVLREEALLRYIVGEKQEIKEADSVSPILSQIASIPNPETSS